jgi:hypothetical protein
MTLTISFKSEGTYTETVRDLDHGLDRAEILAEEIGMVSRLDYPDGQNFTFRDRTNPARCFFGFVD